MSERAAQRWVLTATILASAMGFIDGTAVNVALPALQRELGASIADVQWVVELYALFVASLMLLAGSLADEFGRRRLLVIGTLLFAAGSLWCGLAPGIGWLIAGRAVQGLGAAVVTPASLAIIGVWFAGEGRGRAIGTWSSLTAIAGIIGPVLGGYLVDRGSWRWIFYLNVPLAAAVIGIVSACVPDRGAPARARLDWLGAVLGTAGLGGLTYGLIEASIPGRHGVPPAVAVAAGLAALVAFVIAQARVRDPMMPLGLFRSRTFSATNALTFLLYAALGGSLFYLPYDLIRVQHYGATAAGAALLPAIGAIVLFSRWFGALGSRIGTRPLLIAGPAVAAAGFALFALPGVGGSYWLTFFPPALVLGVGMAATVSPLTATVLEAAGEARSGLASAINNTVARVAGLIAVAALSLLLVAVFNGTLAANGAAVGLDAHGLRALEGARGALAAPAPASLGAAQAARLNEAVARSLVAGFRTVMLAGAALAAAASLCALLWIERPRAPV